MVITAGCDTCLYVMQAILAVGAGSMAVNAVKGVLGGGDKGGEEVSKAAKQVGSDSADDGISKALDSLRKSGKALSCRSEVTFCRKPFRLKEKDVHVQGL